MAQRRMMTKTITNSARFIKMPKDSQALYFHLCMNADDDGVVEAFSIMKQIDSGEDNLRVLSAKNFVKILNEDLVTYITDWNEHNTIRADRKINSVYQKLLVQLLPEAQIINPKPRSDVKDNSNRLEGGQSTDSPRTAEVRLGKDRLGKVRIGKDNLVAIATSEKKEFCFKSKMQEMRLGSARRTAQIIALYWDYKGIEFENEKQYQAGYKRELKAANLLTGYSNDRIEGVMMWLNDPNNCDFNWKLETIHKLIDQPNLKSFKKQPQASGSLY